LQLNIVINFVYVNKSANLSRLHRVHIDSTVYAQLAVSIE